jgi:hypothetical protein
MKDFSQYERTGNNALDLVAQAIGHAQHYKLPVESVTLSRRHYALFWAGTEILRKEPLPDQHRLTFEGIPVLQGEKGQIDSITVQYRVKKGVKKKGAVIVGDNTIITSN